MSDPERTPGTLRVVVVDDEELARRALIDLLERDPGVRIVGEFADGEAALEGMQEEPADILLLDVQMPRIDGLELVRRLGSSPPLVIFVTAYDRYAIDAFRSLAFDYLLKPCSEAELRAVISRARERLESDDLAEVGRRLLRLSSAGERGLEEMPSETRGEGEYLRRFSTRKKDRSVLVEVDEIQWIEADDYCVKVHTSHATHVLRRSLKWFCTRLDPDRFVRVHRSALVNLADLREIQHRDSDEHVAILSSGCEVPLSRAGRELLSKVLPQL